MMRVVHWTVLLVAIVLQPSCSPVPYEPLDQSTFSQLEQRYSVYLDSAWTPKQAQILLEAFDALVPVPNLQFSTWQLTDDDLENGIKIETSDGLELVTMSRQAFPVEDSQEVSAPNRHLYYAVIQFLTKNGTDRTAIESILQRRYGIDVPSQSVLSEGRARRPEGRYSNFENEDLMMIIFVFEAFPRVLHRIPQLTYIVRRIDNEDKGISTAMIGRGCIEFAESAFGHPNFKDTYRVIAHEKTHFLWAYVFNPQLKADWKELGGWYPDLNSESGWSTTKERSEFVSNYAYETDPNEDMAESLAYYLIYGDRLRACSPAKYEFIHQRIIMLYSAHWASSRLM